MSELPHIAAYLIRHGYPAKVEERGNARSEVVVVQDPVYVVSGGMRRATEYKEVILVSWKGAITFIEERS